MVGEFIPLVFQDKMLRVDMRFEISMEIRIMAHYSLRIKPPNPEWTQLRTVQC